MGAVAGAHDANAFGARLREGVLPDPSSLTYQGVFNRHWFHTGGPETASELAIAVVGARGEELAGGAGACLSPDAGDVWAGCFVKSRRDGQPRDATPIDLIVVLDISGSMSCPVGGGKDNTSRLLLAKAAMHALLSKLREEDTFGLATFTTEGSVVQPLMRVADLDRGALAESIDGLEAGGGTTLDAGMEVAVRLRRTGQGGGARRHQRLLFLTDMCDLRPRALRDMVGEQAGQGCYVSFVGISSEFNAELAESVSRHVGCNYFCITTDDELRKVVVDDFDWNFFPSAFAVEVAVQSGDFEIAGVYGTPHDSREEVVQASWHPLTHRFYPPEFRQQARDLLLCLQRRGAALPAPACQRVLDFISPPARTLLNLGTVFPSGVAPDGAVEGGLVLLRLRRRGGGAGPGRARLTLRYTAVDGAPGSSCQDLEIAPAAAAAPAVLKGALLQRYVQVCRRFLLAAAARSRGGEAAEAEAALADAEALLAAFEASPAELEAMCPGVADQLRNFVKMAQACTGRHA